LDSHHRPDAGAGFLVEDFINAVTSQLDRVQDALRLKAVNRPLTYALRELHLELKVFVDMDAQGQVRLRPAGANEQGASAMTLDFTTVTKPMMEENTISMSAARSTPLDALGLGADERQRLERMGVTTLAQLNRLGAATGVSAVARLADLPVERLRSALQQAKPRVTGISPAPTPTPRPGPTPSPRPAPSPPTRPPAAAPTPSVPPRTTVPSPGGVKPSPVVVRPRIVATQPRVLGPRQPFAMAAAAHEPQTLQLPEGTRNLTLHGAHFLADEAPPRVHLEGRELAVEEVDDDRLVVRLPDDAAPGALHVTMADGETLSFGLDFASEDDAWAPPAEPAS
jgi:hypothetical protein